MLNTYESSHEELVSYADEVKSLVNQLNDSQQPEWEEIILKVKEVFTNIQLSIEELANSIETFESDEQEEAKSFYTKYNSELQKIEMEFNELQKRGPISKVESQENKSNTPEDIVPYVPPEVTPSKTQIITNDITEPLNNLEADKETKDLTEEIHTFCQNKRKIVYMSLAVLFFIIAALCFIYVAIM